MSTESRDNTRSIIASVVVGLGIGTVFAAGQHIPLLSLADLGFHELGHLLGSGLGTVPQFLAGSVTQISVPLGLGAYFWMNQRDEIASGLMLGWAATATHSVSVYIADAPFQDLPLIGVQHDWALLLGRWGIVDLSDEIASLAWLSGLAIGLTGLGIVLAPVWRSIVDARHEAAIRARFAGAAIREPRSAGPVAKEA